jgi:hypothetical protein
MLRVKQVGGEGCPGTRLKWTGCALKEPTECSNVGSVGSSASGGGCDKWSVLTPIDRTLYNYIVVIVIIIRQHLSASIIREFFNLSRPL